MADVDWPASLPQYLRVTNFTETLPDNMLASSIDVGYSKRRKRFSAALKPITGSIHLTSTQKDTLDTFYSTSLGGGVLRFNWVDPVTQDAVEMRFKDNTPPSITPNGPNNFYASLELEIFP